MDTAKVEDKPVFIDFWAKWCGPCMDMEENVYPDRDVVEKSEDITFVKVNVGEQGDIASRYGVQSIPTLVFLPPEGGEITKHVGKLSAPDLVDLMDDVLSAYESKEGAEDMSGSDQGDVSSSCPLWDNILFVEIVVSVLIAASIILYLSKTKKDDEQDKKKI